MLKGKKKKKTLAFAPVRKRTSGDKKLENDDKFNPRITAKDFARHSLMES